MSLADLQAWGPLLVVGLFAAAKIVGYVQTLGKGSTGAQATATADGVSVTLGTQGSTGAAGEPACSRQVERALERLAETTSRQIELDARMVTILESLERRQSRMEEALAKLAAEARARSRDRGA